MSSHTYVDIAPFKVETDIDKHSISQLGRAVLDSVDNFSFAGWSEDGGVVDFGKNGEIPVIPCVKNGKTVFIVNEHEYSSVGEYLVSFCSNDADSLVSFCLDVGIDPDLIKENEVVQWTG